MGFAEWLPKKGLKIQNLDKLNEDAPGVYEGATLVSVERKRLQECVGDPVASILVLRNHGIVTLGASVADTFLKMYFLDRACAV